MRHVEFSPVFDNGECFLGVASDDNKAHLYEVSDGIKPTLKLPNPSNQDVVEVAFSPKSVITCVAST